MLQTNHLKNVRRIVWYTSQVVSCYYLIHTALRISYFAVALEQGYRLRHKLRRNTPLGVQTHTSVSTPSLRGSRQCKSRDLISSPQLPSRIRPVRCYLGGPASGEGDRAISVGMASWRKSDHPIFLFFCFVHTFANSHVISWKEQQVQIFMQRYKELFYTCNARAHEYDFSWRQFISVQDEKNFMFCFHFIAKMQLHACSPHCVTPYDWKVRCPFYSRNKHSRYECALRFKPEIAQQTTTVRVLFLIDRHTQKVFLQEVSLCPEAGLQVNVCTNNYY